MHAVVPIKHSPLFSFLKKCRKMVSFVRDVDGAFKAHCAHLCVTQKHSTKYNIHLSHYIHIYIIQMQKRDSL